jgi:folate-dependent phosphoribosylglycinamide formyltransferase PurN
MKKIALFAYDFPHRKTHDFIMDLVASGVHDFVVLAAKKKQLKSQDTRIYFETSLQKYPPKAAADLCANLNIPFYQVEHDDIYSIGEIQNKHEFKMAIISGARIIHRDIINMFPEGIVNFHPGKIPETSGLNSFFYTIKNNAPAGVTTHFIDHRVDAGDQIYFDEALITASSTPETVSENIYQLQRIALQRVLSVLVDGYLSATPIHREMKNSPMTSEEKIDSIHRFPSWRASRFLRQASQRLFEAAEIGQTEVVERILDDLPQLVSERNIKGWTPLIVSSFYNKLAVVELLLQRGANPNECGINGTTALMYAKTKSLHNADATYNLLDFLIASGASCLRTDCFGKTVLDYVRASGDVRMTNYFEMKNRA